MLCRKFRQILFTKPTQTHLHQSLILNRQFSQRWFNILSSEKMSSALRLRAFRLFVISKFLNSFTRSSLVNNVAKKCRRDRSMREVIQYFKLVFFKPRKTHLIVSATAAFRNTEEKAGPPGPCGKSISDEDMESLVSDLEGVNALSRATLFCEGCSKRVVIDSKKQGKDYCECPDTKPPQPSFEGWEPYMEADDIIIWRKEYKPGGLFAYKVYGRYTKINAEDFAMIQIDSGYRKQWDNAVADLSVVETQSNGLENQFVVHWEVLWPRLFTNRDYVFLRRHTMFDVKTSCTARDPIFNNGPSCQPQVETQGRPNVHSKAKQASLAKDKIKASEAELVENIATFREACVCIPSEGVEPKTPSAAKPIPDSKAPVVAKPIPETLALDDGENPKSNRVYVIISRSCVHPKVPEKTSPIRVNEYWSHMVITTINGPEEPGMEFVLTYYDEPAVGGLPTAVMSWAMGRAGPAFISKMRQAALDYGDWKKMHKQDIPNFVSYKPDATGMVPRDSTDDKSIKQSPNVPKPIPEQETNESDERSIQPTITRGTQTKPVIITPVEPKVPDRSYLDSVVLAESAKEPSLTSTEDDDSSLDSSTSSSNTMTPVLLSSSKESNVIEENEDQKESKKEIENESEDDNKRWWHYLYPPYYFA